MDFSFTEEQTLLQESKVGTFISAWIKTLLYLLPLNRATNPLKRSY